MPVFPMLIWMLFSVLVLSASSNIYRYEVVMGTRQKRIHPIWMIIVLLPLIYLVGNRGKVADTWAYITAYLEAPSSISEIVRYTASTTKDRGFSFITGVISCFFPGNYVAYLTIIGAVQILLVFSTYRKYSESFAWALFLFVSSTDVFSWLYNGMRQFMAASIVFGALPLFIEKKYIKACCIVLFAALFHQSALIVIPIVFAVQGEAINKKSMLIMVGAIIAVFFVGTFTDFLNESLTETQYRNVVSDWQYINDNGTNPLRVAVYSVPTVIALFKRKRINDIGDKRINVCVNMSIVSSALYLISMVTSGIYIGRLPIFFSLCNYILLPWEIKHLFSEEKQKGLMIATAVSYLLFYLLITRGY